MSNALLYSHGKEAEEAVLIKLQGFLPKARVNPKDSRAPEEWDGYWHPAKSLFRGTCLLWDCRIVPAILRPQVSLKQNSKAFKQIIEEGEKFRKRLAQRLLPQNC